MQPSTCTTCARPILWAKKVQNGKWNRPLDAMTGINGFILVDGEVHVGTLYQAHDCNLNDVNQLINQKHLSGMVRDELDECGEPAETEQERLEREEHARRRMEYTAQRQERKDREDSNTLARHQAVADIRSCPYCRAKKGQLCLNATELLRGNQVTALIVHKERGDLMGPSTVESRRKPIKKG